MSISHSLRNAGYVRSSQGKLLGGVCAGLARKFETTPTVVRLVFVASCLLPGPQCVAYLAGWILMPRDSHV